MHNTNQHLLVVATFLAICVISFVHVFLFPLYEVSPKQTLLKTISDYEQSLCVQNLRRERVNRFQGGVQPCPRDGIVTVSQGGRLGNQLWEYASVWAVSRRTGLEPYIPRCIRRRLDQVFESLTVPTLQAIARCPVRWRTFVRSLDAWNSTGQSILLPRYSILPELVLTWVQDIRQEFRFRTKLASAAQKILRTAVSRHGGVRSSVVATFVGVHVRRTDYMAYLWRTRSVQLAGPTYFFAAMNYFEQKYDNVVFVVISDDPTWCAQHLSAKSNVYVASKLGVNSAGQDLAVMAACNHSIIDYGTFGVWGAILAGGETILYNVSRHSSIRVSELLSDWHILH